MNHLGLDAWLVGVALSRLSVGQTLLCSPPKWPFFIFSPPFSLSLHLYVWSQMTHWCSHNSPLSLGLHTWTTNTWKVVMDFAGAETCVSAGSHRKVALPKIPFNVLTKQAMLKDWWHRHLMQVVPWLQSAVAPPVTITAWRQYGGHVTHAVARGWAHYHNFAIVST